MHIYTLLHWRKEGENSRKTVSRSWTLQASWACKQGLDLEQADGRSGQ